MVNTKICSTCRQEKPLDAFYKKEGCVDGYRGECKLCCNEKSRDYWQSNREKMSAHKSNLYYANHEEHKERNRKRVRDWTRANRDRANGRRRRRRQSRMAELYKHLGGYCVVCGVHHTEQQMATHHTLPPTKKFQLASYVGDHGLTNEARVEAGKCVLLCCACHAFIHYELREVAFQTALPAGDPQ